MFAGDSPHVHSSSRGLFSHSETPDLQLAMAQLPARPQAAERTPEEIALMQRVIATLFGLSSGKFGFELLPHPENWACGFKPETEKVIAESLEDKSVDLESLPDEQFKPDCFFYSLKEIGTRPVQEIYGVTHHEAAHAQYTSFRNLIIGHRIAESEQLLPTSWGTLLNGLEDGRINRLKCEESEVIREQIQALYKSWIRDVPPKISSQPLMHQYALNAVHYWLTGKTIDTGLDKRVEAVFTQTQDSVKRYINENDTQKSFAILKDEIWPKVKSLETESAKDQALKDSKKPSWWRRMLSKIFGGSNPSQEFDGSPLSSGERQSLEKKFEQLPQKKKDEIAKIAKEKLDARQAQDLQKEGVVGFTYEKDPKSEQYVLKRGKIPDQQEKQESRALIEEALKGENQRDVEELEQQQKEALMRRNGFEQSEQSEFEAFMQLKSEVVPLERRFMRSLEEILPRAMERSLEDGYHHGPRVDLRRIAQRAPVGDARLYQRRTIEKPGDPLLQVELIIDNSGSMEGQKIREARRATVLALETLSRLELPSAVKWFGESYGWIQPRGADYQDKIVRVKPQIVSGLDASSGGTNMANPLLETKESQLGFRLRHPKTVSLVVVISDGEANLGKTGDELKTLIDQIRRDAVIVNINISGSQSDIEKSEFYFGKKNVVACGNVEQLSNALCRVLKSAFEKAVESRIS